MENIVKQNLLYDFYGELLTEHQRSVYEDVVFHDLSLGEIAEERGISRQGVSDLVRRCDRILLDYEGKLHLIGRFQETKRMVAEIQALAKEFKESRDMTPIDEISRISDDITRL